MSSPNVIARGRYYAPGSQRRDFYSSSSKEGNDYVHYMETGVNEGGPDYLGYAGDAEKSAGVFSDGGLLSKAEKSALRDELRATGSVIWDVVISFKAPFGQERIRSWGDAQDLLARELPRFFRANRMRPSNVVWYAALHENTDNRHIHLSFYERNPERLVANKPGRQWHQGKLRKESFEALRVGLEKDMTSDGYSAASDLRWAADRLAEEIRRVPLGKERETALREGVERLASELPGEGFYENEEMAPFRGEIDEVSALLSASDPDAERERLRALARLEEEDRKTLEICLRDRIDPKRYLIKDKCAADYRRRVGNRVIAYCRAAGRKVPAFRGERAEKYERKRLRRELLSGLSGVARCLREEAMAEEEWWDDLQRRVRAEMSEEEAEM
jgi:hypothetical protein